MAGAKEAAWAEVEQRFEALIRLSHAIHAHPETAFEEHQASKWTAGVLADGGFEVTPEACGLQTAFVAERGSGPLAVAICAEYDALPQIGHACGHNIIAASAVGAGLALGAVADDVGITVRVIGTPAEELGGGKAILLERGAFDDVHAAMMIHPWNIERLRPRILAVAQFDVAYTGKEAHASGSPWEGVNAADAMTIAQVSIGLLRQQLRPGDQVHGVVTSGGGAANVIPSHVTGRFMRRAPTADAVAVLEPRLRRCFEAGALATGATLDITRVGEPYAHLVADEGLLTMYRASAEALGRRFDLDDSDAPPPTLSTDMGNISLAVPSIHPLVAIDSAGAVNHQPEFAEACVTPSADAAVRDGAIAMAWTAIEAAGHPDVRERLLAGITPQAAST